MIFFLNVKTKLECMLSKNKECILFYVDTSLSHLTDIKQYIDELDASVILALVYSYENTKVLTNELIIQIKKEVEFFEHKSPHIHCICHINNKYNVFVMKDHIINDIHKYNPKYMYIHSENNTFLSKYLDTANITTDTSYLTNIKH